MMIMRRWLLLTTLLIYLCPASISIATSAEAQSHQQAVLKLFELTRLQQKIGTSVENVLALQLQ